MSPQPRRRRVFAATALALGTVLPLCVAPLAATAQPSAVAPSVSVGDGTLAADASLAILPLTYQCEAGTSATIVVKLHQSYGEHGGVIDGHVLHTVACTGETTTDTVTIESHHRDPWQAGQATGEVSIFGQDRATAHQPFTIALSR